jgi:hypothetical protein
MHGISLTSPSNTNANLLVAFGWSYRPMVVEAKGLMDQHGIGTHRADHRAHGVGDERAVVKRR